MTTAPNSAILEPVTNPVLTVAPQNKEDTTMSGATNKITALYCRLSQEDARLGESLSIENQVLILCISPCRFSIAQKNIWQESHLDAVFVQMV